MSVLTLLSCLLIAGYMPGAEIHVRELELDFSRQAGLIKPLHDIHSGPLSERGSVDLSEYYRELGVKYIRLHDIPWTFGGAVDINYVFPKFDADPDRPENYRFQETDYYLNSIKAINGEMIFRLGYSAEIRAQPKIYNAPPNDYEKWARICVNIVRHYNAGWANGFHYGIRYWEIWNEPDIKNFWTGSPEDYYRLYEITAKAIKEYVPEVKVGGPAAAGHLDFIENFLRYCRERSLPVDFLSWHTYSLDPYGVYVKAVRIRELLDKYGFSRTESHLTEWNYFPGDWDRLSVDPVYERGIFEQLWGNPGAAFAASVLVYLQDSQVDVANFYTGTTLWWGLFDRFGIPMKNYYTFRAFRWLLDTPVRIATPTPKAKDVALLAGLSKDGAAANIFLSNFGTPFSRYEIKLKNLPWAGKFSFEIYMIDHSHDLALVKSQELESSTSSIVEDVEVPSVCLIKLRSSEAER